MILINPSFEILDSDLIINSMLKKIEMAGRVCYKSESNITSESAKAFIKARLNSKPPHESILEHEKLTVRIICDRGVSHELVRHRIASFSQESTRFCNYSKDRFNNNVTFIIPNWLLLQEEEVHRHNFSYTNTGHKGYNTWVMAMIDAEERYQSLITKGWTPQQARSVLPNSLKTEIIVTANLREWRHIFSQRIAKAAHPQMREIMIPLLEEFKRKLPVVFDDIT